MQIVVVIPTYNEAENISLLVPELQKMFNIFPHHTFSILIVDGNSPDGTGDVVNKLGDDYPNVYLLLEEKKAGIGAAYLYGFEFAMRNMQADVLVEMDADLQHKPEDFPKLIEAIDDGAAYVIGSRYISGGSIPKEWEFYRKFLSIAGNIFSKFALGIFTVSDFTTGFKAARVKGFVDQIDFSSVNSLGFAYKIDLLHKMHKLGAKIVEVPITFGVRDRGSSKIEGNTAIDSLKVVLGIRYKESQNFIRFIVVGFTGLFVDSSIFSILRITTFSSAVSSAVSGLVGMITTYTLNNVWSFKNRGSKKGITQNLTSFILYFASSYLPIIFRSWLINYTVVVIGTGVIYEYGAFFIGILVGLIWNYVVYSRIIWKKR